MYLISIFLSLCIFKLESKNFVVQLKGENHYRFSSRFNCKFVAHIPPYHICTKNNNSISILDMKTTSKYHPGIVGVFEEKNSLRSVRFYLNDPDINEQTLFIGNTQARIRSHSSDLTHNLFSLWERGITGRGVVVAVVDDGIDVNHRELSPNLDLDLSYNFVHNIPSPHTTKEVHGTKCSGLISAKANNSICGVGSAPDSVLVALKVLSASIGEVSDSNEARAFNHRIDRIQIMSMSWGPLDDGMGIGRPSSIASRSFEIGITKGRSGKGVIYIFPSGNGRRNFDFCGLDGYLQKYAVFVIGSSSKKGEMPPYAERCTAILASTLSNSNSLKENKIYTTYPLNKCGRYHTGTSVSAPIASGIIALVLQVNPDLTRRDIQDMIIRTSRQIDPYPIVNGAGRKYSMNFGFGLLDAHELVAEAEKKFSNIMPELIICSTPYFQTNQGSKYGGTIHSSIYSSGCLDTSSATSRIEVVIVTLSINSNSRGLISAFFTSPSNTRVPLLESRVLDTSDKGLVDWDIKVMAFYGEEANGVWHLEVDSGSSGTIELLSWGLKIYGSLESSIHLHNSHALFLKRFCLPVNFKKDPKLELLCLKTTKESNQDSDPYAYIDSLSIIWQPQTHPNLYGISFLTSIFLVFSVLSLILLIIHRLTYRKFIAPSSSDPEKNFLISRY